MLDKKNVKNVILIKAVENSKNLNLKKEKIDFSKKLKELNSNLNLQSTANGVYSKKYDYANLGISKNLEKSKRVELRKLCTKIYYSDTQLESVKKFIATMEKSLLVCTKDKKKFYQLTANDIFSNYNKLDTANKKIVDEKHKLFVELTSPSK